MDKLAKKNERSNHYDIVARNLDGDKEPLRATKLTTPSDSNQAPDNASAITKLSKSGIVNKY